MLKPTDNKYRVGEVTENIAEINRLLLRDFGQEYDGRPRWRVVWADDELEKRKVYVTPEGWQLLYPKVEEVKKYLHIKERYVLERLIPVFGETDLTTPYSYEPAWTFEDRFQQYLPPRFDACKFVVETIYGQLDRAKSHPKYKDESVDPEYRAKMLKEMEVKLFGNETPAGDALAHDYGVTVPGKEEDTKYQGVKKDE